MHPRIDVALTALVKTAEVMGPRQISAETKNIRANAQGFADLEREIAANPWFEEDLPAQIKAHDTYADYAEGLMGARLLDSDAHAGDLGAALPFSELKTRPWETTKRFFGFGDPDPEMDYMSGHYGNFQSPKFGALGGRRTLATEAITGSSRPSADGSIKLTPEMAKVLSADEARAALSHPEGTALQVVFAPVLQRWEHGERTGEYYGADGQPVSRADFLNAFAKKLRVIYRRNDRAPLSQYRELATDVAGGMDAVKDSWLRKAIAPVLRGITARGRSLRS